MVSEGICGVTGGAQPARVVTRLFAAGVLAASLSACVPVKLPKMPSLALPAMRWDHRPEASQWTTSTLMAVAARDDVLASRVPGDIAAWCPGYAKAPLQDRRAFWVGLLSAVAKYESSWNPRASGGGGRYLGLMQISPGTASNHGCNSGGLKDGSANLACAVKIVATQVGRDGVVAGRGNRGIGRDWGPFKSASKRAEMAAWTSKQGYCQ